MIKQNEDDYDVAADDDDCPAHPTDTVVPRGWQTSALVGAALTPTGRHRLPAPRYCIVLCQRRGRKLPQKLGRTPSCPKRKSTKCALDFWAPVIANYTIQILKMPLVKTIS